MCRDCGCGDPELVSVELHERILGDNERRAAHLREHFADDGVTALNVMGSPGAGKTALLEATSKLLDGRWRLGAFSGDLATDRDADRLVRAGIPAASITTGSACHLDAKMVHHALHHAPFGDVDFLFIENVGNLVCPAIYDLGQAANVVVLAVTEGEDKPLKYPLIFRHADLVVLTKIDLLPHLDVDVRAIEEAVARVMPTPRLLPLSARSGAGLDGWIGWLEGLRAPARPAEAR